MDWLEQEYAQGNMVLNNYGIIMKKIQIQLHHEEHEGNEVKPGSAGRLTGFMI